MEYKRCSGRYLINNFLFVLLAVLVVFGFISLFTTSSSSSDSFMTSIKSVLPAGAAYIASGQEVTVLTDDQVIVNLKDIMRSPIGLSQDEPKLIKHIRKHYLRAPSKDRYNLEQNNDDPSKGQSKAIREILGNMRGGFFIECGALDGETRSNSLVFEKTLGWSGVLIEADPKNYDLVLKKNRKAWTVSACLSTKPYPNKVIFKQKFNVGKISSHNLDSKVAAGHVETQCLPVYSILLALNVTTVDYFSLDVEGVELEVLETIPWDKVNIKTLSVEFIHGARGKATLKEYMESKGYWVYKEVTFPGGLANDFIFVKNSFKKPSDVLPPKK